MNPLNLNAFLNKNFFHIHEKKILIPSNLDQIFITKERIIISFGGEIPNEILNSKELLFRHRLELNHNIWCFDFYGNLLWKIPSAYSDEQHQANIEKEGLPLPAAYQGAYKDPDDENNIIAYNGYADYVFIRISDGTIVKQEKRGK